jgi:hypothetical protein
MGRIAPCGHITGFISDEFKRVKLTIPGFPYNPPPVSCVVINFKEKYESSISLEIRPQIASRVPLPAATNSA